MHIRYWDNRAGPMFFVMCIGIIMAHASIIPSMIAGHATILTMLGYPLGAALYGASFAMPAPSGSTALFAGRAISLLMWPMNWAMIAQVPGLHALPYVLATVGFGAIGFTLGHRLSDSPR